MEKFFKLLLSPMAFAMGFLWPLITQSLVALGYFEFGWQVFTIGAVIAFGFGSMATIKGSWIWIK